MEKRIKVPFVKNSLLWKGKGWCGPIALASLLRYYKNKSSVNEIAKISKSIKNSGGTIPEGLTYFCLSNGFSVDYYGKYKFFDYNKKEFSERFNTLMKKIKAKELAKKIEKQNKQFPKYKFKLKSPTLKDIEKFIKEEKPVLLYLNIAVVENKKNLWPHYVLVVGFDKENFYVHNIYPKNKSYQKIPKKIFKKAWKSEGMDYFLLIPHK
ncbi:hypothetical protein GW932_04600 [archaeon]|nr:hypothetical protein [archaeon]